MARRNNLVILALVALLVVGAGALSYLRGPVLGLDLRGGAEVVLEAQPERGQQVTQEQLDQSVAVLRERVDALGVAEPSIQTEGGNRITIAVAGEKNPDRVFDLVGSTGQLYFIDLQEGLTAGVSRSFVEGSGIVPKTTLYDLLEAVPAKLKDGDQALLYAFKKGATDVPLNPAGAATEAQLLRQLGVERLPTDVEVLGVPKDHLAVKCSNQSPAGCPPNITPVPQTAKERFFWYLFTLPPAADRLTGDAISSAKADFDTQTSQPVVLMNFTDRGGRQFERITKSLAERGRSTWSAAGAQPGQEPAYFQNFAIILDGELKTYPTIDFQRNPDGIEGGAAQITGLDSPAEAAGVALVLQSGSLPVRFVALSSSQVSATLGEASLREGLIAGIAGLLLMMLYLAFFYRVLGLIAGLALVVFAAIFYGVVLAVPITLTLPGIAGMILTIGVAADANIVVFERIREEYRTGKSLRAAISAGYSRGLRTIVDANVVTLITAAVLIATSQSSVRGFAFLLAIGVIVSMLTAIVFTRALLSVLARFAWFDNARVIGASSKPVRWRFDFAGRARVWCAITACAVIAAVGLLATQGLNLGLDFTGGTRITIVTTQTATPAQITETFRTAGASMSGAVVRGEGIDRAGSFTTFQVDAEEITPAQIEEASQVLRQRYGLAAELDARSVSASFGTELLRNALLALGFSILFIIAYVSLRFGWRYAVPMIVALLHDLLLAAGAYALFGFEVTSASIAALLTILGYSLYDTIIVFDRIRENERLLTRHSYPQIVNISLWETATRSLNTSFSTLLPVTALFLFGGETLRGFAFALIIGIIAGTYSSFFVATPLLAWLRGREAEFKSRKGSDDLPSFLLGDRTTAPDTAGDTAPASTPAVAPEAAGPTTANVSDEAIAAARRRREQRKQRSRR